jgi:hypothetical protein
MFKINDLGGLSQLLIMHVTRDMTACTISLDKFKNVKDILARRSMTECKPSSPLIDPGFLFGIAHMNSPLLTRSANDVHPSLMGSLQYAYVPTRPYVSSALRIHGSAHANPTEAHLQAVKKVVRYLRGTIDLRITLGRGMRTTASNIQASRIEIGRTTRVRASHVLATCLHSAKDMCATSPNYGLASPCPHARQSTALQ